MSVKIRRFAVLTGIVAALLLAAGVVVQQIYDKESPETIVKLFAAEPKEPSPSLTFALSQEGYEAIEGQTYEVSLEEWGKSTFVTAKREDGRAHTALFLADGTGHITYRFPEFYGNERGSLEGIRALDFRDANHDGLTDVILIAEYVSGVGEEGADSFPIASVYLRDGQKFRSLPMLDMQLNETGQNESIDVVLANVEARLFRTSAPSAAN
ncbi:hypothetical protein [Cohnella yongneupensis]|uniref:VCBS repeat-containing protein n=1 Tax=Cohnella yongneupensis TaxID=425006 RepID=A0ABW0QXA2_9BACL